MIYEITIIFLLILLLLSLYYNYKFGITIIKMEDAIEISLDKLDNRYERIQKVLNTPLFYDSPQVRQVLEDIRESRDSILYVANQLARIEDGKKEED
jgi:hypothetical protein